MDTEEILIDTEQVIDNEDDDMMDTEESAVPAGKFPKLAPNLMEVIIHMH